MPHPGPPGPAPQPRPSARTMSRIVRICSKCGGPLTRPLPPDLLDPRLGADGLIMQCADCGHAERVDVPGQWRTIEE